MTDRISEALAKRREEVSRQRNMKRRLEKQLAKAATLETGYLIWLLQSTWERLPDDLTLVCWGSPTADTNLEQIHEVIAIGEKVADVFSVYNQTSEEDPA